jgi:MYXO-CTERM domain-containing protein
MTRLAIVLAVLAVPVAAEADCAATCESICYSNTPTALFLGEVIEARDGFTARVRITERLGGAATVLAEVGDEREDVYSESPVALGDELVFGITEDDFVFNAAWRVEADVVQCSTQDRTVALGDYVDMATREDCEARAAELDLATRCDDTVGVGCSAGGGASVFAMLGVIGLLARRRR